MASPPSSAPAVERSAATSAQRADPLGWLRQRAARFFQERDVGPEVLALFALALSCGAAFVFLMEHFGIGACLATGAFLLGEIAVVPRPWIRTKATLAHVLHPASDLLVTAGLFGGVAIRHPGLLTALALVVVATSAWLPRLRVHAGADERGGLWGRADRTAILLAGALLGRPGPAFLAVGLVLALEVWLLLRRMDLAESLAAPTPAGATAPWRPLLPNGDLLPAVRWISLATAVVVLLFLPTSAYWRF